MKKKKKCPFRTQSKKSFGVKPLWTSSCWEEPPYFKQNGSSKQESTQLSATSEFGEERRKKRRELCNSTSLFVGPLLWQLCKLLSGVGWVRECGGAWSCTIKPQFCPWANSPTVDPLLHSSLKQFCSSATAEVRFWNLCCAQCEIIYIYIYMWNLIPSGHCLKESRQFDLIFNLSRTRKETE